MRGMASTRGKKAAKFVDTVSGSEFVTLALNTTGSVLLANGVQEGTGFWNRLGETIRMKSLHLVGQVQINGNSIAGNDYVRILVLYDRQPTAAIAAGVLPTLAQIFANVDQAGAVRTANPGLDGLHPMNRKRFAILADERIVLPGVTNVGVVDTGSDSAQKTCYNINRFIPLKGLETQFSSTANPCTIANIESGALYVVSMGAVAAGSEGWKVNASWRLRFHDEV